MVDDHCQHERVSLGRHPGRHDGSKPAVSADVPAGNGLPGADSVWFLVTHGGVLGEQPIQLQHRGSGDQLRQVHLLRRDLRPVFLRELVIGVRAVALRHELERVRLRELLDELAEQLGPPDETMVAEAVGELTALAHPVRTAELPEQHRATAT